MERCDESPLIFPELLWRWTLGTHRSLLVCRIFEIFTCIPIWMQREVLLLRPRGGLHILSGISWCLIWQAGGWITIRRSGLDSCDGCQRFRLTWSDSSHPRYYRWPTGQKGRSSNWGRKVTPGQPKAGKEVEETQCVHSNFAHKQKSWNILDILTHQ